MVVSGHPLATRVGRVVLEQEGNAVDAAVATAFALSVVEPAMSGLGGRTQILVRLPDGSYAGIEGYTEIPAGSVPGIEDTFGYRTVAIPGTVAALAEAARRFGSMPLGTLLAPAIELAESGFPMTRDLASFLTDDAPRLSAGARASFLEDDGTVPAPGELFTQPALGRVLRALAVEGPDVFYRGWIADSMAVDMARNGGFVTAEDLAAYAPFPAIVVEGTYRGWSLAGTWLPGSGGTTIEALHLLEPFSLESRAGSSDWLALVAQALLISFEDREADLGTPEEHAALVVSREWAARRAASIVDPADTGSVPAGSGSDEYEAPFTTHLSVADASGMLVSLTQSLGPALGSKVATPSLGFLYAATMGYLGASEPGARPFSSQSPLVVTRDGAPAMVLGGAGSRRIISAMVGVLSHVMDGGETLETAMSRPRLHPTGGVVRVEVSPEASWPMEVLDRAGDTGLRIDPRSDASYFARLHGIQWDPVTREFVGVADPRGGGSAEGPGHGRAPVAHGVG